MSPMNSGTTFCQDILMRCSVQGSSSINPRVVSPQMTSTNGRRTVLRPVCLMPKLLFKAACGDSGQGLTAIETLADLCVTSLTATAIRYAKLCDDPVGVICSKGNRVEFAFMSKPFQDMRGLAWIRKGSGLPAETATARFNKDEDNVRKGKRVVSTSTLDTSFDGGSMAELNEEIAGLGDYGKTLTVLWADSLPEPDEAEESEESEDENLLPSQRWRDGLVLRSIEGVMAAIFMILSIAGCFLLYALVHSASDARSRRRRYLEGYGNEPPRNQMTLVFKI
jgi:hypothetical protein